VLQLPGEAELRQGRQEPDAEEVEAEPTEERLQHIFPAGQIQVYSKVDAQARCYQRQA